MENRVAARKSDWQVEPMPRRRASFLLRMVLTQAQYDTLLLGHIPEEMEDHWFCYAENGCLMIHRSWSGFCIYEVQLRCGAHLLRVTVNREPTQYTNTSAAEDRRILRGLLSGWLQDGTGSRF